MRVFIANFGHGNSLWPECLKRQTVATFNDLDTQPFWEKGDHEGYVQYCVANKKTATGITPTRPVASRWFNLMTTITETVGDVWIHREKGEVWWTTSKSETASFETAGGVRVAHKPCEAWSSRSRAGTPLLWEALHPKAKAFLFTEGTLQQLSDDNAEYALALIDGAEREQWHALPSWRAKADRSGKGDVKFFDAEERAALRMADTALQTAANSLGQEVTRKTKVKEVRFKKPELETYLKQLLKDQEGLCAITGLRLGFDGDCDDKELLASLDRIDSDGHYEVGNLQVVCRFVNRWKNDAADAEFRRLIALVRSSL